MSKVNVAGESVVVTSSLKLEDIKLLEKYRPESLELKTDKGEVYFAVKSANGHGDIGKYGASFGKVAPDGSGFATITLPIDVKPGANVKEVVADLLGVSVLNLNKVEAQCPAALEEIGAERAAVLENITVA